MTVTRIVGRDVLAELEQRLAQADEALNRLPDPPSRLWFALGVTTGHRLAYEFDGPLGGWPEEIGGGLATIATRLENRRRGAKVGPREALADARLGALCRAAVGVECDLVVADAVTYLAKNYDEFRTRDSNTLHLKDLHDLLAPTKGLTTTKLRKLCERPIPSATDELERMGGALKELDDA